MVLFLQVADMTEAVLKLGLPVALVLIFLGAFAFFSRKVISWYEIKDLANVEIQKSHTEVVMKMMEDRRADLDKLSNVMSAHTHAVEASTKVVEACSKVVEQNTTTITSLVSNAMREKH